MSTILVIGGSSGIGSACVKILNDGKNKIYATFYSNKKANKKSNINWDYLDITDTSSVRGYLSRISKLDGVVICASLNKTESLDHFDTHANLIFETNIISQIRTISLLKSKLKKNSSIVLFGSVTGRIGSRRRIAYSASKSAIFGFVKSLAAELSPNVRVNAVCPGYINTEQYIKNSTINEFERTKKILLGRLGTQEEVAHLVRFLLSKDSSYINSQMINIDGGLSAEI